MNQPDSAPATRTFSAAEAGEAARIVANARDDEVPRLLPEDRRAAELAIEELNLQMTALPEFAQRMMRGARVGGRQLSDDRLQGLAELIQNADDLGAESAVLTVDQRAGRLLFRHDGAGITLSDVLALSVPFLSMKTSDSAALGRFGIGLSTLRTLSDTFDAHEGHFHFRLQGETLTTIPGDAPAVGNEIAESSTTFAIPVRGEKVRLTDIAEWLGRWGEAGMVFLSHLRRISLVNQRGDELLTLELTRGQAHTVQSSSGETIRQIVRTGAGHEWTVYSRLAESPAVEREAKAKADKTPIAIALPRFAGDVGHLHIGLPVRSIGLPFRINAQFDPVTSRRDVSATEWTLALVPLICALWVDATIDTIAHEPAKAWNAIPLSSEFEGDQLTQGPVREALERHLFVAARLKVADEARLTDPAGATWTLGEHAVEVDSLTPLLTDEDLRQISNASAILLRKQRGRGKRWRAVLEDLRNLGAAVPVVISVEGALVLLSEDRGAEFVTDLMALALESNLAYRIRPIACLYLSDGERVAVSELGGRVFLADEANKLWKSLGIGLRLDPAHLGPAGWLVVEEWLISDKRLLKAADDSAALRQLSQSGSAGHPPMHLDDAQAQLLRDAMERLGPDIQAETGVGIGLAVTFDATGWDAEGGRVKARVRPAESYINENDAESWYVAAAQAPGLLWLHRRYNELLRSPIGRDGLGAQRFFRVLGAEVAPRLVAHAERQWKYSGQPPGVPRSATHSPARRIAAMDAVKADFTLNDLASPDLDSVLEDLARQTDVAKRRRRTEALLATLNRAWVRYDDRAQVQAVDAYMKWNRQGTIDAWWLHRAASIAWLEADDGELVAPAELRMRTTSTERLYGDDFGRYLSRSISTTATAVLRALGVKEQAGVDELIDKLRAVRAEYPTSPREASEHAAPIYSAIAAVLRSGGRAARGMTPDEIRRSFSAGAGLISSNIGWRSPSVTFLGPAIFGDRRAFAPAAFEAGELWTLLGIRTPTAAEAVSVLREIAKDGKPDPATVQTIGSCFDIIAGATDLETLDLRKLPLWTGDGWTATRPILAVDNPLVASELSKYLKVWIPGGPLGRFAPLLQPLGLETLEASAGVALSTSAASAAEDFSDKFAAAIDNLRADLAIRSPDVEASWRIPWSDLGRITISVLPDLTVQFERPSGGEPIRVRLPAWLDLGARILYLDAFDQAGQKETGYAISAAFEAGEDAITYPWVVAWVEAERGVRAAKTTTAASEARELEFLREEEEAQRRREEDDDVRLREFAASSKTRRDKRSSKAPAPPVTHRTTGSPPPAPAPTRNLVDPARLIVVGDGSLLGASPRGATTPSPPTPLRDPTRKTDVSSPRPGGIKNFTDKTREDVGMQLVAEVLGRDIAELNDVREQRGVGADALDELQQFYELKVHAGPIPDQIRLQDSEMLRALETKDFFLVLVGNVEEGGEPPEVRVITDPLAKLTPTAHGHVVFSGIRSAKALRYVFGERRGGDDSSA